MAEHDKAAPEREVETTAHEWDGIQELNTPLPRWWLWTFYVTILFAMAIASPIRQYRSQPARLWACCTGAVMANSPRSRLRLRPGGRA